MVVERIEPVFGRDSARELLRRFDIGGGLRPHRGSLRREPTLLFRGQGLELFEAPVDPVAERDEPLARGRVALLDGRLAQVVSVGQEVPDDLDAVGLLDRLLTELLERGHREAEGDQSGPSNRHDRQQHHRERQPQAAGKR